MHRQEEHEAFQNDSIAAGSCIGYLLFVFYVSITDVQWGPLAAQKLRQEREKWVFGCLLVPIDMILYNSQ